MLFRAKSRSVIIAAAPDDAGRMLNVKHLVEQDVLDEPLRYVGGVERFADSDGVVRCIMVPQNAPRPSL